MFDGMLNFKTHFMVWNCIWHEDCNGLFNIRNLVSSLILITLHLIWEEMEAIKKILRLENKLSICLFF